METKKQDYYDLIKRDFGNIFPTIWKGLKVLPLKALSWSLKMIIMVLQFMGILFLFASLIVGIVVVWKNMWSLDQRIYASLGLFFLFLMFIAIYHESLERRIKKKSKKK